ncbi:MAG: hypothetical protein H0V92_11465, partial [Pseudonocardiales bacterium]|nr:hypothetical protein [Pseudonocardiales bacterium]
MNKSSRRVLRTTAAVLGVTALGAVGSGTAFADTVGDVHGVSNGHSDTDFAPADDSAGLPSDELGAPDMHTFQMPSLGDQNVRSTRSSSSSHDGDSGSSDSGSSGSDNGDSAYSSSDESGSGSKARSKSKSTDEFQSANYKS